MYYTLKKQHYLPQIESDVVQLVRSFQGCTRLCGALSKQQKLMKLFSASELLEIADTDLLGPLKETAPGNTIILIIADRFIKVTRCIPLQSTTADTVPAAITEH